MATKMMSMTSANVIVGKGLIRVLSVIRLCDNSAGWCVPSHRSILLLNYHACDTQENVSWHFVASRIAHDPRHCAVNAPGKISRFGNHKKSKWESTKNVLRSGFLS